MAEYLLGIDNGGTMSKSAIYDLNGNEIATASAKTELIMPQPGYTEKDMGKSGKRSASPPGRYFKRPALKIPK